MKKILLQLLLVVGIATSFVACSKDEEVKAPEPTLIGNWEAVEDIERTFLNNALQLDDTTRYDSAYLRSEITADGKIKTKLMGTLISTSNYIIDTAGGMRIVTVNTPLPNDTTYYNKVVYTLDSLILSNTKIQVNGSVTIKSVNISKFKKY